MEYVSSLNEEQKEVLLNFYAKEPAKVSFKTSERKKIWDEFKVNRDIEKYRFLEKTSPALFSELNKALMNNKNVQPAVFSECVYAQAFADKYELSIFENHLEGIGNDFNFENIKIEQVENLTVRYSYSRPDKTLKLVQAGGASGVDCALISYEKMFATMLELKEPYARTSAPDLPKYGEDGYLITNTKFEEEYPQFKSMLEDQIKNKFNIFDHVGNNFSDFSKESIETAVKENYAGDKFADFICTEDASGLLVLIPSVDIPRWAKLEGELRPTGRNSYPVWTPKKLNEVLIEKGATISGNKVNMPLSIFKKSKARGGQKISRYKISPLFFVRSEDVEVTDSNVFFSIEAVRQNIPDITTKINLKKIQYSGLKEFYIDKI